MKRPVTTGLAILAVGSALALAACGGGGGGGGGGGVVSPPPSSPPASPPLPPSPPLSPPPPPPPVVPGPGPQSCGAAPGQLQCSSGSWAGYGPAARLSILTSGAYEFDVAPVEFELTVNIGNPATPSDDIYRITYLGDQPVFSNFTFGSDGFGPAKGAEATAGGAVWDLVLFDVSTPASGSLDYAQIGFLAWDAGPSDIGVRYFVNGPLMNTSGLPTSGSARFTGGTRGFFASASGDLFLTASDVSMNVNFGTRAIAGDATNFRFQNEAGQLVSRPEQLNFTFNATINANTGAQFSGVAENTTLGLGGILYGRFFGEPNGPPTEAGFAYQMDGLSTPAAMAGAAALNRTD